MNEYMIAIIVLLVMLIIILIALCCVIGLGTSNPSSGSSNAKGI